MIVLLLAGLAVGPIFSYATNEVSYTYRYLQGSLTGPQFAPGANWYPDLGNGIISLGLVPTVYAKAIAGNIDRSYVAPQPDKTPRFDAGFAAAYLGLPLKGHHTQEYINGYINGTASYEFDRGMVFGYNEMKPVLPTNNTDACNFIDGYSQGLQERKDIGFTNYTIPATDDDYRNYFVGYHNGNEYMGDYAAAHDETAPYVCPSALQYSKEYCAGFIDGEADEGWELFDA